MRGRRRIFRPSLNRDVARTVEVIVQEERKRLLARPPGMVRDRVLDNCKAFLDALADERSHDATRPSRRETAEHYRSEAKAAEALRAEPRG